MPPLFSFLTISHPLHFVSKTYLIFSREGQTVCHPNCQIRKSESRIVAPHMSHSIILSEASCISHWSLATGDASCFTKKLALTSAHVKAFWAYHAHSVPSIVLAIHPVCGSLGHQKLCNDFPPNGNSHLTHAQCVGHNQGPYHRLTVSLWWILSPIYHARLLFITALHGDNADAIFMLTWSTAVRTAPPGAGFV